MSDSPKSKLTDEYTQPHSSAVLVIDVQNDFCREGGYYHRTGADLSTIDRAVERLQNFLQSARAAGTMIVFIRSQYDEVYLSHAQKERRRRVGWDVPLCRQGTEGFDFYKVRPLPEEVVITKHRFDAFYGTDLEMVLRTNGRQNLLFTGVATNVCVESSLRSAFMRDFSTVLVEDCCAARKRAAHDATIDNVHFHFGIVARADDVERLWRC